MNIELTAGMSAWAVEHGCFVVDGETRCQRCKLLTDGDFGDRDNVCHCLTEPHVNVIAPPAALLAATPKPCWWCAGRLDKTHRCDRCVDGQVYPTCPTCQGTKQAPLHTDFGNGGPVPPCRDCLDPTGNPTGRVMWVTVNLGDCDRCGGLGTIGNDVTDDYDPCPVCGVGMWPEGKGTVTRQFRPTGEPLPIVSIYGFGRPEGGDYLEWFGGTEAVIWKHRNGKTTSGHGSVELGPNAAAHIGRYYVPGQLR